MVLPVRTDPTGASGPTRRQASGPRWRRSSRGYYVPATVERTAVQRVAEVGVLLPQEAWVTGWAALCWRGARWLDGTDSSGRPRPVDVAAPGRVLRDQDVLRVCRERVDESAHELVDGLAVASSVAAVAFAMRYAADVDIAVVALDMAYRADLVSPVEVTAWVDTHPAHVGIQRARDALLLADENSWSPRETRTRLAWQRCVGTRPLTNRPLFDPSGRHLGTPDLLDPVTGVCGEYDGDHHLDRVQRRRDLAREQRMLDHGLTPFTLVAGDLGGGRLQARLRSAMVRAARLRPEDRRWTLDPPPWWRPTLTVAQRGGPTRTSRVR